MPHRPLAQPKYRRQRFLLTLLQLNGPLSPMDLQKHLFLATRGQAKPYYDFVPYRYGSYSFQAEADLARLDQYAWLKITRNQVQLSKPYPSTAAAAELTRLHHHQAKFGKLRGSALLRYVYTTYPYYAIHSNIAARILRQDIETVQAARAALTNARTALLTIGYEGLSLEAFINRLIKHDVKLLCDVRRNPLSRKFGFSKSILARILPQVDITYQHLPALGIDSQHRQGLTTTAHYAQLFTRYKQQLPEQKQALRAIATHLKTHQRVALTCFEHHAADCHRHCISDHLQTQLSIAAQHI